MSDKLEEIIKQLKPYLREYLDSQSVEIDNRGFLLCVNKDHDEKTPSMSFMPNTDDTMLHCFGCGCSYDIYHAAHNLEDMPLSGPGFITSTVKTLAERFRINFDWTDINISDESILRYRYYALYRHAYEVLKEIGTNEHTKERGWSDVTCKKFGIGTVNWETFEKTLKNRGAYSSEELLEKDIKADLFSSTKITFTIFDHKNNPIGFVARNVNFNKKDKATYPKYRNTSSHVPIYNKSLTLYGLNIVQQLKPKPDRIDLFEGYPDWVTAQQNGITNSIALGGTALTEEHVKLLKDLGYQHINVILDGDNAGDKSTASIIAKFANQIEGIRFTVMELDYPNHLIGGDRDPDNYFKFKKTEDYLSIKPLSTFEWSLTKYIEEIKTNLVNEGIEKDDVDKNWKTLGAEELRNLVQKMLPHIFSETSPIEQGRMAKTLAEYSGVKEGDIKEEIKTRSNKQINQIADSLSYRLKKNLDSVETVELIKSAYDKIQAVTSKKNMDVFSHEGVGDDLKNFYKQVDTADVNGVGWKTGWDFFDNPETIGGIHKKESIYFLAGAPNFGKSAILMNIARRLLLPENIPHNKKLTLMVSYLDDATSVFWSKMLASMTTYPILDVAFPNRVLYKDKTKTKYYNQWRNYLRECVADKRLLVKGHNLGSDIKAFEYWIKHVQDTTGNDVVFLVDAFHDITIDPDVVTEDQNSRFIQICDWMQRTTEELKYSILTCAHITKGGIARGRPEQNDILNTGKMQFSAKMIGLVYSDLDYSKLANKPTSSLYWEYPQSLTGDTRRPIVELNISKNKLSSYKGLIHFKHLSESCHMELMTRTEVQQEIDRISLANQLQLAADTDRNDLNHYED